MRPRNVLPTLAFAVLAGAGLAHAQQAETDTGGTAKGQASAPAESSDAAGHDVQTGRPESGQIQNTVPHAGSGQTKSEAETTGGASTQRLDVPSDSRPSNR